MNKSLIGISLAILFSAAGWAHEGGSGPRVPIFERQLQGKAGSYRILLGYSPRQPIARQQIDFEFRAVRILDTPDPLLGGQMPLLLEQLQLRFKSQATGAYVTELLEPHAEGEAGVFGISYTLHQPGAYLFVLYLKEETGNVLQIEFPFAVEQNRFDNWLRIVVNGILALLVVPLAGILRTRKESLPAHRFKVVLSLAVLFLGSVALAANLVGVRIFSDALFSYTAPEGGKIKLVFKEETGQALVEADPKLIKTFGIRTAPVAEEEFASLLTVQGKVVAKPDLAAVVSAPLWGRIEFTGPPLAVGDYVHKDQPLVRIVLELAANERTPMMDRFEDIKSTKEAARQRFEAAKAQLDRVIPLAKDGFIFPEEEEWARERYEDVEDDLRLLEQQYAQYQGVMRFRDPRNTPVVAPIDGYITAVNFVPGELNPNGEVRELFSIVDLSEIWLEAEVFEGDMERISRVRAARVLPQAFSGEELRGRLQAIVPIVREETRTLKVIFATANPGHKLKLGMLASIVMEAGRSQKVTAIPKSAILEEEGKTSVYVKDAAGRFEKRLVELGSADGDKVQVRSGVSPGEEVVVAGLYQLQALHDGSAQKAPRSH